LITASSTLPFDFVLSAEAESPTGLSHLGTSSSHSDPLINTDSSMVDWPEGVDQNLC